MNDASKLLLTVAIGGAVLGAGLSRYAAPRMNHNAGEDWRERYRATYSDTSMQFVDAGPIDTSPSLGWPGTTGGLYQAAMIEPDYRTPEFATSYETHTDPGADLSPPPAPIPETTAETVDDAAATAATLQQNAGAPPFSEPATQAVTRLDRMVSPNNSEPAGASPSVASNDAL